MVVDKNRIDTEQHRLQDAVRGATKNIKSSGTGVEETTSTGVKSFDSDGFTLGTDNAVNGNTDAMVSWNWKANGQGSANTTGTINSSYTSANTTSGFSIVTYTGTGTAGTIGHGLGAVPTMIITKIIKLCRRLVLLSCKFRKWCKYCIKYYCYILFFIKLE